jgi:hypothetical protein
MSSVLFGPTSEVEELPEPEPVDLGLMTSFETRVSALSPFEGTRERRRRRGRESGGERLGELLVSEGVLSPDELAEALAGLVSPPLLVRLLAQQCQLQLEEQTGFGTGLRRAIEHRHTERAQPDEPAVDAVEDAPVAEPATVSTGPRLLGELLVAQRLLTPEQLRWALVEQAESGRLLGEVVVQHGLISMVALVNALVAQLRTAPER